MDTYKDIYLAGGCFWGLEAYMKRIDGVQDAISGYANGRTENPAYEDLIYRDSGHAETVRVTYDPSKVNLPELLIYFFRVIDPTSLNRQGNDRGTQYRTGIYYTDPADLPLIGQAMDREQRRHEKPMVTEVLPLVHFYPAEDYHQDYLAKNPNGYCHIHLDLVQYPAIDPARYPAPKEDELNGFLSPEQVAVLRQSATERPFANQYWNHFEPGLYVDAATGEPLFSSKDKFESFCGWPSFVKPVAPEVVTYRHDTTHGMVRTEVRSRSGDNHLGHVFDDGPVDRGGLRYCINSAALRFVSAREMAGQGYGYLAEHVK